MSKTILVVDDSPSEVRVMLSALEGRGYQLLTASDGEEALMKNKGFRPDLILLDLRLPRIDGMTVLGEIKSAPQLKSIPVVVLTSSDADPDVGQAYLRHTNSYLVKPLDLVSFEGLMKELGLYWFTWNQSPRP